MNYSVTLRAIFCILAVFLSGAFSGHSPFSKVHVVEEYSGGAPATEVIDLTICLETSVNTIDSTDSTYVGRYEKIIEYLADGLYEMSNGANKLGTVRIFPKGRYWTACDVEWRRANSGPSAMTSYYTGIYSLYYSDVVLDSIGQVKTDRREYPLSAASSLLHETMHYIYGLDDEYGQSHAQPNEAREDFALKVDVGTNEMIVQRDTSNNKMSQTKFERMLENYVVGSYVVFFTLNDDPTETPRLPTRLKEIDFKNRFDPQDVSKYHKISHVDRSNIQNGEFRFQLKNFSFVDT